MDAMITGPIINTGIQQYLVDSVTGHVPCFAVTEWSLQASDAAGIVPVRMVA